MNFIEYSANLRNSLSRFFDQHDIEHSLESKNPPFKVAINTNSFEKLKNKKSILIGDQRYTIKKLNSDPSCNDLSYSQNTEEIVIYKNYTTRHGKIIFGEECGIKISPSKNATAKINQQPIKTAPENRPIDAVFTWVNNNDPKWLAQKNHYAKLHKTPSYEDDPKKSNRYYNRDELDYALRSIKLYAPFIRKIYVVTDNQTPDFRIYNDNVEIINHKDIFPNQKDTLPTFNSHSIESRLHHIDNLSENFIYFNDDFFLGKPQKASDFFSEGGLSNAFFSHNNIKLISSLEKNDHINYAARTTNNLIEKLFNKTITNKIFHAPYALNRELLLEIENVFEHELSRTTRSRFRSNGDVSTTSSLYQYYAYAKGRAVSVNPDYKYIDISKTSALYKLTPISNIYRERYDFICMNDGNSQSSLKGVIEKLMKYYLENSYPTSLLEKQSLS